MSDEQNASASKSRGLRFRLSTLLLLVPLLALVGVMGFWIQSLRHQVQALEERVAAIEQKKNVAALISQALNQKIPESVDKAMLMDGLNSPRSSMPTLRQRR